MSQLSKIGAAELWLRLAAIVALALSACAAQPASEYPPCDAVTPQILSHYTMVFCQ